MAAEKITRAEVEHVAHLARLHFSPEELDGFTRQLNEILAYVAKIEELDTECVEPTTHAIALTNAFREDEVRPGLDVADALANAPEGEDGQFVVPRVI
ncbi:Asp-tRNA(Asn)/Glu-tRNA(Gln) amidotransferase subunit GatC [Dissulfurirhabdus thermomarina]|uniref:Aspartyl/glutamyl-tRNA(Asn/Gln) amidotransferase subunit C n=1 Tax=Dissulfurirhabdus thermomarina TaxID=1765737 RepID=A0A6N9TP38_DISTH|nr:Asp-tRNA(Asn)/Glu-tRNA(Gln) amidotransferase subunit GatC [Dissulfurirhabdus thermomarina]NDY42200.1 Asp-tRNA(Asn)/Glu-tRNA(Gln) amidotransferase subunit GatC [Dissulfurirhabdus thermomarina]NMX22672.1 Asp-tRNA(Asn)/Glu-tRNA(Gln) amidotransferase subunit GatC [Dissulfurirhabdus thermomarina]